MDTWAIELLGRWGSDAVRGYIRDARLANASDMARRVAEAVPLEVFVRRILTEQGSQDAPAAGPVLAPASSGSVASSSGSAVPPSAPLVHVDLSAPLADAVALARADLGPPRTECPFVLNSVTGVAHRIVVGPDVVPAAACIAAYGWKFGLSTWRAEPVRIARDRLPRDPRLLCKRCLPDVRQACVDMLASAVAPGG